MDNEPTLAATVSEAADSDVAGTGFDFERKAREAVDKEARRKQQNRDRQARFKARHSAPKLAQRWAANLASLSEPERQALPALAERRDDLMRWMLDTIAGIANGRIAGVNLLYPDLLYAELRDFLIEYPAVKSSSQKSLLTDLDAKSLARFDDRVLIEFGLETRIFESFWNEFCRMALIWCDANPNESDPAVASDLRLLVQRHDHTPVPAPPLEPVMSEREREGYIVAAESQRDHVAAIAAEQVKFYTRNMGQSSV